MGLTCAGPNPGGNRDIDHLGNLLGESPSVPNIAVWYTENFHIINIMFPSNYSKRVLFVR